MKLALCLLLSGIAWGQLSPYTDQTVLLLDVGAKDVAVTNLDALGGVQHIPLPVDGTHRARVWLSRYSPCPGSTVPGFTDTHCTAPGGSATACTGSCAISLHQEYGPYSRRFSICDLAGTTCGTPSSFERMPAVNPAPTNSPYTVPLYIYGTGGNQKSFNVPIAGGQTVSGLRLWTWLFQTPRRKLSVGFNSQPMKLIDTVNVIKVTTSGTVCTMVTDRPHGLSNGQLAQLNFFNTTWFSDGGQAQLNGNFNVTVVDDSTFTVPCTLSADASGTHWTTGSNWNADLPPAQVGYATGKTVSGTVFYSSEEKFFGGMDSNGQAFMATVPIGASELTAGATNVVKFQYNGAPTGASLNQWVLDWNVVEPDKELDQIVVTGLNAVARTTTNFTCVVGDTYIIQNAPGPLWRFNLERVVTACPDGTGANASTHFTFLWGPDTDGFQEYETLTQTPSTTSTDPFYTAPGTYVVRTARDTTITPNQHMYAARAIIAKSNFVAYKPSVENRVSAGSVSNGHTLFDTVPIKTRNPYFNHQELTPCAGCHMDGGFSFKYGQAPSDVIHFGAVQDGFSDSDAEDILAYIQSNTLTPPVRSRWWNPLLQGGKTCGSISSADRLAGNGIRWKLVYDQDLPEYLIPGGSFAKWAANQNLDFFCIPLPITNPHWIRWFPAEHPLDFFASLGLDFTAQAAWTDYVAYKAALKFGAANNFTQLEKGTLGGSGVAYRIGAAAGTDDAKLTAPNTQAWDLNGLAFKTTGVGSCTSTNVEVGAGGASSNAVSITETLHHSLFVLTTSTSGATATIGDTKGETFVATLGSPYSGSAGLPTLYYSWYVKDTGAGANTITAAYSGSNQYPALSVVDCSNVDHVNTFDAQHSASGSGTAGYVSSGNFTTSAAGDIIIGWGNYAAAGGFPAPSILTAYEGNANYLGNLVSPSPDISAAKAATGIFDYKNTPSRGMACYQAPTFVCQASHYLSIWWSNRTLELIQAIAGLGGKHDTIIADYMLSSQGLTLDSHSGAYTPNGYFTNALFDTGPHKANIGDNCFHLQFQGLFTCANTILDTAMWYMLQFQQGNRNHFASGDNPIDVPYNYLFTGGLSGSRSMFWMSWMGNSQNAQMTWGWPNMNNMDMTYLAGKFMIGGLNTQGHDQFITEAEKATVMNEWVQQFLELKARFTVAADWQTKFPCTSPLAGGAALAWGTSSSQICQDWAMTLPILNHYNSGNFAGGPNPADIDTIQDWLQTLYPTPGGVAYNWTTERNEPCSFNWGSIGVGGNNNPPVLLSCTFQ